MAAQQHSPAFAKFELPHDMPKEKDTLSHRQWPWRILPFTSDLGTVGYLVNRHQLGLLGWLIAMPYYLFAIGRQPDSQKRKEELLYQSTANGILPFAEAKLGTMAGEKLGKALLGKRPMSQYPIGQFQRILGNLYSTKLIKACGGFLALAILTPMLGDPISRWIGQQYRKFSMTGA